MSARRRRKVGGQARFCAFPQHVFQSPQFALLSARAVKALVDLYMQYRGTNNGDLTAAWRVMHERGWRSKAQLRKAVAELEARGWVMRTRQGGRRTATLYAVTFRGIDYCAGKLDAGVRNDSMPMNLWQAPGYAAPMQPSGRRVRAPRSLPHDTGQSAPHGGAKVLPFQAALTSVGGQ